MRSAMRSASNEQPWRPLGPAEVKDTRPLWTRVTQRWPRLLILSTFAVAIAVVALAIALPLYLALYRAETSPYNVNKISVVSLYMNETAVSEDNSGWMVRKGTSACPFVPNVTLWVFATQMTSPLAVMRYSIQVAASMNESNVIDDTRRFKLPAGNMSLVLEIGPLKKAYKTGNSPDRLELTQDIIFASDYSSHAFYPMDAYDGGISASVYLAKVTGNRTRHEPLSVCLNLYNSLGIFTMATDYSEDVTSAQEVEMYSSTGQAAGTGSMLWMSYQLTRPMSLKLFAFWVVFVMWALGCCVLGLALDMVLLRPRDIAPPLLGVATGLLFALPSVRNLMPDAPAIGSAVDVLGFYWNQSMTALAAITLMCALVGGYKG